MAYEAETEKLKKALISCKVPDIGKAVDEAHAAGMPATEIINTLGAAMSDVGVLFERGKLFLPHVLSAAAGMKAAMNTLDAELSAGSDGSTSKGVAVMGTVEGDIHEIGKNVCCAMLRGAGYRVIDLGPDVSAQDFIDAADENEAQVLGGSALMTTTLEAQRELVQAVKEVEGPYKCIFGGAPCSQEWCDEINADGYSETANEIIGLVDRLTQ